MASRFGQLLLPLLFFSNISAQSNYDQQVSISVRGASIPQALKILSENASVKLAFSESFFDKNSKINLREKDSTVRGILTKILKGTSIDFKEIDGQIVLYPTPDKAPQKFTLSGFVEDASSGERLIAAAVYCPELGIGTVTNAYGFYSLTLPENIDRVTISYLGYQEEQQPIQLVKDQFFTCRLQPAVTLAEVVVTPHLNENLLLPSPANGNRLLAGDFKAAPDLGGRKRSDADRSIVAGRANRCRRLRRPAHPGREMPTKTSCCWTGYLCTTLITCWVFFRFSIHRLSKVPNCSGAVSRLVMAAGLPPFLMCGPKRATTANGVEKRR